MVQSWYTELVKYEKHDKVMAQNRQIYYFTTSYKNNLGKFCETPPVQCNETVKRYEMERGEYTGSVK